MSKIYMVDNFKREPLVEIKKSISEASFFVADRWFRIIEFSLILATLYYFQTVTDNLAVRIAY